MQEFSEQAHSTIEEYDIPYAQARYAIEVVLTDCLSNYRSGKLEWIQGSWAKNKNDENIDPLKADALELHSICKACLTSAISYSAVTRQRDHKINALAADSLTSDFLWEVMIGLSDYRTDMVAWTDGLNPKSGKDVVITTLEEALRQLNQVKVTQ